MNQLTLRGFSPELEKALKETARRRGISLNKAAILLLRRGAGLMDSGKDLGPALSKYTGSWQEPEARELGLRVAELDKIEDEGFWK